MRKIVTLIKNNIPLLLLGCVALIHFVIAARMNVSSYNNFDFGKFDLGNMTQMLWNTLHGRFLYMTDYFGTNLPRWSMSHVDPILLLFVPIFAVFQHPLTLVISQLILVISSSFIIYFIALDRLKSKLASALIGISFLLYPAVGFLNSRTGFHGVSAVIPFFLLAFYLFEHMYYVSSFSKRGHVLFWLMLVLTMAGKEQLPLYVFLFGLFIVILRPVARKLGFFVMGAGLLWFIAAFIIIIPAYSKQRVEGYTKFANSMKIDTSSARDVALPNYFLSRYEGFGDSYVEIAVNSVLDHKKAIKVFFGGDKPDNLNKTFEPLMFLPLLSPQTLIFAGPDFFANYMTTAGGIGTAEIGNHRISMIIPVLFISVIFAIEFIGILMANLFSKTASMFKMKFVLSPTLFFIVFGTVLVFLGGYTSQKFNNPVYQWLNQAVGRRIAAVTVFAKFDKNTAKQDLKFGEVLKLTELENKDVECANKIISIIPQEASVSGPDYLGAHLSMRETYAIFPALYNEADYVIVDVFSRKILNILDIEADLVRDVVKQLIVSDSYTLHTGCGNLFVFKKEKNEKQSELLPLQERNNYDAAYDQEFFQNLKIADFKLPTVIRHGEKGTLEVVYHKAGPSKLDDYVLFMTFVNNKTGEVFQMANLPSYALIRPEEWKENRYYIEDLDVALPAFVDAGEYKVFIGMTNRIRTRSIYLGNIKFE
jgi:uncharacterized membrane protein